MIGNIIQSYLVSLGVQIDRPGFQQADHTIRETGANIERVTSGMARNFVKAQTIIASAIAGVTASALGLMKATANQDLAMQKYARSMMMSEDAAWRMKKATDALGESINDIALTPELLGRFNKLTADGSQMKVGGDFKETMKDFRDLIFEFTRLKQEASYALNWVGYYLMKYLQKPLADIREKFKSFNDMVIKNMSVWTEKVARGIYYVIEVGRHFLEFIFDIGKHLKDLWDSFPKGAKIAIAAITAINVALSAGPLGRSIMLLSTLLLLIDDYYGYMEGKNAALGPYWDKLNEYLETASQWYETLKKEAGPYWDMVVSYAKDAAKWIEEVVTRIKEWGETSGQGLLDSFLQGAKEVGEVLADTVKVTWEVISTIGALAAEHLKHADTFKTVKSIFESIWERLVSLWHTIETVIKFVQNLVRELMKTKEMRDFLKSCMDLTDAFLELIDAVFKLSNEIFPGLNNEIRDTSILYALRDVLRLILTVMTGLNKITKRLTEALRDNFREWRDLFNLLKNNQFIHTFFKKLSEHISDSLDKLGKFARALAQFLKNPKDLKAVWDILKEDTKGKKGGQTSGLTPTEQKWEKYIQAAAAKNDRVSANTLRALMMAESGGDENARSDAGAIGLMQLMPETAADLGVNPYDAEQNIDGGARYLNQMLEYYNGDARKAIAAYNWGSGNVDDVIEEYGDEWENYLPDEPKNHIKKVLRYRDQYESNTTYGYTPSGKPFDNRFWRIWSSKEGMDAPWDSTATNVQGWKPEVVDFMNELGPALNRAGTIGVITGAAEGSKYGHEDGPYSHGTGYKVDIDDSNIPEGSKAYDILQGMVEKYGGQMVHEEDRGHYDIVIYPAEQQQSVVQRAADIASEIPGNVVPVTGDVIGAATETTAENGTIEAAKDILALNPIGAIAQRGKEIVKEIFGNGQTTEAKKDGVLQPMSTGLVDSQDSSSQWGLSGMMAFMRELRQSLPTANMDLVTNLVAGGAGSYRDYAGSSYSHTANVTNNVNVDLTINGEGKTNADVAQMAADTVVKSLESRAAFQERNLYSGSGGPAFV